MLCEDSGRQIHFILCSRFELVRICFMFEVVIILFNEFYYNFTCEDFFAKKEFA